MEAMHTSFMSKHGLMCRACAQEGRIQPPLQGGHTIGVNSEMDMDALPGIGHVCCHNPISRAGVTVIKAAMEKWREGDFTGSESQKPDVRAGFDG